MAGDPLGGPNVPGGPWSIPKIIVAIIIIAACIGIMYVVLGVFGVAIPAFVVTIFWILVAAIVGILAIMLLLSFWRRL